MKAFDHLPSAVLVLDSDLRLLSWNRTARSMFGPASAYMADGATLNGFLQAMVDYEFVELGDMTGDAWIAEAVAAHVPRNTFDRQLADGRTLRVRVTPSGDGLVAVYNDVTDLHHRDIDLETSRQRLSRMNEIGVALTGEKDLNRLLEMIMLEAKTLCRADGGTIYLKREDEPEPVFVENKRIDRRTGGDRRIHDRRTQSAGPPDGTAERRHTADRRDGVDRRRPLEQLEFAILVNDTLNIAMGGTSGQKITLPNLMIYDPETGEPNEKNVASYAALTGEAINIPDAYDADGFDFSGTRKFDEMNSYRSKSFLTVPLKDRKDEVIGVLQLINAHDEEGAVVAFDPALQSDVESLASQAAVSLDNNLLLLGQRKLFESLMQVMANAIDRKSPYTGGHCSRVPALTEMLAQAACNATDGPLRTFSMDQEQTFALHVAGWLHDIGKVTTPEYVMDKSTKLETIHDRIVEVETRFAAAKRDAEIEYLRAAMEDGSDKESLEAAFRAKVAEFDEDLMFLQLANVGGEFMAHDKKERVNVIAAKTWRDAGGRSTPLLSEEEVYNLCIERGTLTGEERKVITDHMEITIEMLEQLPFPKSLRRVPEFAGGHHEKMDGSGYPRGLTRDQMSIPARIMAIADIFEALTAADRPYKQGKTISESIRIMTFMRKDGHIDPELFDLFIESGVYREYGERFLNPDQIDEIDVDAVLGRKAS
ncbi:MAG: GAF domain-containing protein [Rhodospirillaceae bacterium]|nr:GAF domain-containing protein [Rhodospirillaceae bacterium]MBT7613475.1 GAF domain-containing protein [Rhodospirillaceae bacterium]